MENEIKSNLSNPEKLEKLYRDDRKTFRAAFEKIYPEIENSEAARFWKTRLDARRKPEIMKVLVPSEITMVIAVCLLVAFLVKIPKLFHAGISDTLFFEKYVALIVFSGLTLYTMLIRKIADIKQIIIASLAFLIPAIYVAVLPANEEADSLILAYIHRPLLLWFVYGFVYSGFDFRDLNKRTAFIRYNGDLAIVYALIAIAGGILTAITIGLFSSIGFDIGEFYAENIVMTGAAAAPVVAAFLLEKFPTLVNRAAQLIATIFSPLVLLTLVVFLITIAVTGKDPYNDRDFLLVFNIMLLGVVGIIIFSVSETSVIRDQKFNAMILFILSIVSVIIDMIALSAIFYRLGEYGLTPNRVAVLVSNLLVLTNLILIMIDLFRINFKKKEFRILEITVAKFLPVYLAWIILVVFAFPLIFGMR